MRGLLGIGVILLLAWGLSEDRARIPWRVVVAGVLLQFGLAFLFLTFPPAGAAFLLLNRAVDGLQSATEAGTGFVFGYLGGGQLPFAETRPGASFIFAFRALPLVLVISALATLLLYCSASYRRSLGCCAARSGSAARSASVPQCTSLSAISRRRS